MSINNFIPSVWSATLLQELDREYVAVRNSNREFEGDIKKFGDRVHVNALGEIDIFNYTKDTDMSEPQTLEGTRQTIRIDQVKAFNFQIDDIDRAQAVPNIMQTAMRQAAKGLASEADRFLFNYIGNSSLERGDFIDAEICADTAIDVFLKMKERLLENGVNTTVDTVLEVTPAIAAVILKSKILQTSDNVAAISNGYIGDFLGFRVYVSNHDTVRSISGSSHMCIARTTRAVAFAEQLHEIEAYRPELRFADAVKGLHMYGASVIYPKEVVTSFIDVI